MLLFIKSRDKTSDIPKRDNWEKIEVKSQENQITNLDFKKEVFVDDIKDGNFYVYPSIPTNNEYIFNKMIKFNEEKILVEKDLDEIKDLTTPLEFEGYGQNINSYNRLILQDKILLNANSDLYLINKEDFSYESIKKLEPNKDYNRRFKYLYLDGEDLYYILNEKNENGGFQVSDSMLHPKGSLMYKENIKTHKIEKIDLKNLEPVVHEDFIHSEYVSMGQYILNIVGDSIYSYNVLDGKNEKIMTKKDYYFDPAQALVADKYYIERSIFGNYGLGIFDKLNGELVNTIVDNNRYGSIHNMKQYGDYLLLEPSFNSNAKMNNFKIVDLKNKKTYYYNIKELIKPRINKMNFEYRVFAIEDGFAYIQVISQDKSNKLYYNLFKLELGLDIN